MPDPAPEKKSAPLFSAEALLLWYDRGARALPWRVPPSDRRAGRRPDPYRVWLSEIMLQQTTIAAVRGYFLDFTSRWPTVADLAAAPLDDVLARWAGLGYYARARNLHKAAQAISGERAGIFPTTVAELEALPGIGAYTAAAIAAICHDARVPVIDGNVERVLARLMRLETPPRDAKAALRAALFATVPERAGDFAQALMDLGATLCAPRAAACGLCPLRPDCAAATLPDPTLYPRRPVKAERPIRRGHAYVMTRSDGSVFLVRRLDKGLLARMAGVPVSVWAATRAAPDYPMPGAWHRAGDIVHVFTHFRLELT
ncbi:MAG: A/G-specific adenine glycosylase, partial [Alphaproteobacteria bacterium]|nr:A/G-specific adenine glycosylase [Alphaproteobacteria bacterium]